MKNLFGKYDVAASISWKAALMFVAAYGYFDLVYKTGRNDALQQIIDNKQFTVETKCKPQCQPQCQPN